MIAAKETTNQDFLNCWEYMKCEREPRGRRTDGAGVCPASTEERLNGVHGGKNAGRACWVVAGSFADGDITSACDRKHEGCTSCNFYQMVKAEEGNYLWPVAFMHKMIK